MLDKIDASTLVFQVKLPFPPSVNGLYGGGSGQQRFKTKRYKTWCGSIKHMPSLGIDYPVRIDYLFTWPDNRTRDGQNYIKAVTDILVSAGVLVDDNWSIIVSEKWSYDRVDKKTSGVLVSVYRHTESGN